MLKNQAIIIDHDDSFVWNIHAWLSPYFETAIINHQDLSKINIDNYQLIIFSPGPKSPQDYPQSLNLLKSIDNKKAVLGICLGLQIMTLAYGGKVVELSHPIHGKTSPLITKKHLKWDQSLVGRYHSLHCLLPSDMKSEGTTTDGSVMLASHKLKKQFGMQFHPESFLTEKSIEMAKYIYEWAVN